MVLAAGLKPLEGKLAPAAPTQAIGLRRVLCSTPPFWAQENYLCLRAVSSDVSSVLAKANGIEKGPVPAMPSALTLKYLALSQREMVLRLI